MKIKIKNGKWNVNSILLDFYINSFRVLETPLLRSKISKENNYQFKTK